MSSIPARELLFHPILFEVHSLKLLAAHNLVNSPGNPFPAMRLRYTMTEAFRYGFTTYGRQLLYIFLLKFFLLLPTEVPLVVAFERDYWI
jgi:hypothetical protein